MTNQTVIPPSKGNVGSYNKIFEKLVDGGSDGSSDLLGFVAYGKYKIAKREWVTNFGKDNGYPPTNSDIEAYTKTWTDTMLVDLKSHANQSLAAFAGYVIEQEKPEIVKDALQHKSFVREAGVACCGALFYTLLLIVFALLLKVVDIDLVTIVEKLGIGHHAVEHGITTPDGAANIQQNPVK